MNYRIQFPDEPMVTSDCHDRSFVKLPTGHPVAIETLKRLGCTVEPAEKFSEGKPCWSERLGEVIFVGHSKAWPGNSVIETTGGIIQRVKTESLHPTPELFDGTLGLLGKLAAKGGVV